MAQSQFLNDFQAKMNKLTDVRRQLQVSIQSREAFTNELKTKLNDLNNRMRQLTELINQLKNYNN